ncbi:hypothetical protein [Streptosporangium sp. OZ121]|uniref:hypothetical protein n=1 Tax=Streptosporangium sp. OZ121 TaxID=3444183 RepID=UPI003F7A521F
MRTRAGSRAAARAWARAGGIGSSYDYMLSAGLMPLGLVLAGPVSEALGVYPTLYAMSAVAIPAALALLCVPAVRCLPARPPAADSPDAVTPGSR